MSIRNCCRSTPERGRPAVRLIAGGAALVAAVVLAAAALPHGPYALDRTWSEWMRDVDRPALSQVALVASAAGRGVWRVTTIVLLAAVLALLRRRREFVAFAALEMLTPAAVNAVKEAVNRPRPPHELIHGGGSSYPSGHAAYAGATTVALVLLLTAPGGRRWLWWSLAVLATAGMAWSRTYLQVHWLTDALAGALLGMGTALACAGAVSVTHRRSGRRPAA